MPFLRIASPVSAVPAALVALLALVLQPAQAAPRYPDIMPIGQVKPGMRGYGLTVFRGTRIERFNVTVVGVVKKGSLVVPGHDMILVRMSGGPMTSRNAYLIRGMSGSPVYIRGKLIGAFSQGEPDSKEPLGGVTPIEDMLETWDPRLPVTPEVPGATTEVQTTRLAQPLFVGGRRIEQVVFNAPSHGLLRSRGVTAVLQPCATTMTVSGLTAAGRKRLADLMAQYNVEVVQGAAGGPRPGFAGAPLRPGAAMSMMLVTGDITMGSTGTVTYRQGSRILGFGHPFMGLGPIQAPLCSAYIYDVYPLLSGSYKISSPGPIVGSSMQDRNFAISGQVGVKPRLVPVTVQVRDLTTGRHRTFRAQTVPHLNLYASLVSATVASAVAEVRGVPGDAMARVVTTVHADEVGKVTRTNTVYDAVSIADAVTGDLDDLLGVLTRNPFYRLGIRSAHVSVELRSARETATLERIFLKEGRYEPGATAEVGVVLKPYRQPEQVRALKLAIPADTPTGRYTLQVRGGGAGSTVSLGGLTFRTPAPSNPDQAPPASVRHMVRRYAERERSTDLVARVALNSTAVSVDGERLRNLPPHIEAIWRSARTTGVRLERNEIKVVEPTKWVLAGQQSLTINIQRRETQETPAKPTGAGAPPPPAQPAPPGPGASAALGIDDDEMALAARHGVELAVQGVASVTDGGKQLAPAAPQDAKPADADKPAAATSPTPPSATATAPDEKPVTRAPSVWRQSARADFGRGQATNVSVSSAGDLALARSLRRVAATGEDFVWCVVPDGRGGVYAGTGPRGRIVRVDATGAVSLHCALPAPEVGVHALLSEPGGALLAATGPHGRVYRVSADGKATVAFQAPHAYALALARGPDGAVYVGTGGGEGVVYRIGTDGKGSRWFRTSEKHVLSLAVDAGVVYAGTGEEGVIYRITGSGQGSALYDAPESSVTALAVGAGGDVCAATAPRGVLYRIDRDGRARTVYDKAAGAFTSLVAMPGGTVAGSAGSSIYTVSPGDEVASVANRADIDITALAAGADGTLYAGTGHAGELYAAAAGAGKRTGVYESVVHDARDTATWGAASWSAVTPSGTTLALETRSGSVAEPDATWSAWSAVRSTGAGTGPGTVTSPAGRFLQYRLTLGSEAPTASPVVRDVSFTYLPRNQAPRVTFAAPAGGERWSRKQTVRWTATDPDRDTLSYELQSSADGGATWKALPVEAAPAAPSTTTPAPAASGGPAAPSATTVTVTVGPAPPKPTVAEVEAELAKHPDLPAELRAAVMARAREVNAARAPQTASAGAAAAAGATRETSRSLDTAQLPDGTYLLRVVATDRPSNALDPATVTVVSEPFVVCNAAPSVHVIESAAHRSADGSVTLEGVATQRLVPVGSVQFRVDGKEWMAAAPADGLFDSGTEAFRVATGPLAPGRHTVEVLVFSAAGVSTRATVTVGAEGALSTR